MENETNEQVNPNPNQKRWLGGLSPSFSEFKRKNRDIMAPSSLIKDFVSLGTGLLVGNSSFLATNSTETTNTSCSRTLNSPMVQGINSPFLNPQDRVIRKQLRDPSSSGKTGKPTQRSRPLSSATSLVPTSYPPSSLFPPSSTHSLSSSYFLPNNNS